MHSTRGTDKRGTRRLAILLGSLCIAIVLALSGPTGVSLAAPLGQTTPPLGAAASFSVLAQTAVTNVPSSVLSGDVGLNTAGTNYAGLTTSEVGGTIYDTNGTGPSEGLLPSAVQADALAAFTTNIPGQPLTSNQGPALDGLSLPPGVYDIGAGRLNGGVLILDGPGVYIFRASSDFVSSGSISFINGADPCNLFWRVETLATINGSSFAGTILAGTGVHIGANVTFIGRALAIGGDVTMISDTITVPVCVVPTPTATTPTATGTPSPAVSGLPDTGGAPIQDGSFPWSLVIVGGLSAAALALGVRAYRRNYLPKQ